jgi:hypothetical protein
MVHKNIIRISLLPERACIFAFTSWQGYIMIALMMTVGMTLRTVSFPKYYLSLPYTTMGGILITGGLKFYRETLNAAGKRTM